MGGGIPVFLKLHLKPDHAPWAGPGGSSTPADPLSVLIRVPTPCADPRSPFQGQEQLPFELAFSVGLHAHLLASILSRLSLHLVTKIVFC